MLKQIKSQFPGEAFYLGISGSAGMGLADDLNINFLQEVYATRMAVIECRPRQTDAIIELGGEDAKILFLTGAGGLEVRMNGTCAGGTGAFIDQMATLLDVTPDEMNGAGEGTRANLYHCLPLRRISPNRIFSPC